MSFGNRGGFAYPTRSAFGPSPPNSGVVQSDQEFNTGWQNEIARLAPSQGGGGWSNPWQAQDIDSLQAAIPFGPGYTVEQYDASKDAYANMVRDANSRGELLYRQNGQTFQGTAAGAPEQIAEWNTPSAEFMQATNDYRMAGKQRQEAQIRNQQAYDVNMMGNNAQGGVIPANYSDPNYGQITGQKPGGLGGLGGMDLTSPEAPSTGIYNGGSGVYNPNPFGAGSYQSKGWSGF